MKCNKGIYILLRNQVSIIKTLYVNFRTLDFSDAIKLPIVVSRYVKLKNLKKGSIVLKQKPKTFMIQFGFGGSEDLLYYNSKKSLLMIRNGGQIVFDGSKARFSPHFSILVDSSILEVGEGFTCNNGCSFSSLNGIKFGNDCLIGGNVIIRDSDGHRVFYNEELDHHIIRPSKVEIGEHVWICNNCNILKGVVIGNNNIISYNTTCIKSILDEHCLIGGHVGTVLRRNINWER